MPDKRKKTTVKSETKAPLQSIRKTTAKAKASSPTGATASAGAARSAATARKSAPRATSLDLSAFRALLSEERKRLLSERERIEARTARHGKLLGGLESQYDDHMADIATETHDREIDLASQDQVGELLEEIGVALAKIETGTYGVCDVCEKPISKARLLALPYATLCIECQNLIEH